MTWTIYRPDKKSSKKYWKVGIELSINYNTNICQIYTLPQFLSMSEKNCGIYWLDSHNLLTSKNGLKSSKQLKKIFPFMSVLNTLQYKQRLCILTIPKCNTYFTEKIFTNWRPEKSLTWYRSWNKLAFLLYYSFYLKSMYRTRHYSSSSIKFCKFLLMQEC